MSTSHFKPSQFNIKGEPGASQEPRVIRLDAPAEPVVTDYQFGNLDVKGKGDYRTVKSKFGALAATDPDRASRSRKDSRFSLNPLLRDPLAVEQEERRVIDSRVDEKVAAVRDQARREGHTEGFEAGRMQGFAKAHQEFQAEAAERLQAFESMLASMEEAHAEVFRANERYLIELVFRIARMIALKELSTDRDYVLRLAKGLIESMGVRENIRMEIHPRDLETVALLKEGLEKHLGTLKNLSIEASESVELGGCRIETQWNAIDARIETQLQGIHDGLLSVKGPA
jgi:flagellar assembly protein FliH